MIYTEEEFNSLKLETEEELSNEELTKVNGGNIYPPSADVITIEAGYYYGKHGDELIYYLGRTYTELTKFRVVVAKFTKINGGYSSSKILYTTLGSFLEYRRIPDDSVPPLPIPLKK